MRRIAILGGGMAGLTAAWSLSDAACRDELEVTIYQHGWRLGGTEEHGLGVWPGWYENAFRLMRQVYEELDSARAEEAWQAPSVATFVRRGLGLLLTCFAGDRRRSTSPEPAGVALSGSPTSVPPAAPPSMADFMVLVHQAEIGGLLATVEAIRLLPATTPRRGSPAALVVESLERMREDIAATAGPDDDARRVEELADLVITCIQGIVRDGLLTDPAGFEALDHLDFRDWMAANGAAKETLESPLVRGICDLVSAYEDGDPARPRSSAGLGLLLTGKLLLDSRVSMGEVVFAPMYQALRARGVRFAFFHRVDRLQLSSDGGSIAAVTLWRQARLDGGRSEEEEVRLVAGEDFDDLVLATPLGMVPHVCGEPADQSGCDNLFLAGDRTDSGVNVGSIESAVMAGIQAANGVRRRPLTEGLVGAWRGPRAT